MVFQIQRCLWLRHSRSQREAEGVGTPTLFQVGYSLVARHLPVKQGSPEHNRIATPIWMAKDSGSVSPAVNRVPSGEMFDSVRYPPFIGS